jgi:hypothetical protein
MKQRSRTQPAPTATPASPSQGLPRWEQLAAEHRHALIIALAGMMVKRLSSQSRVKGVDNG